ncbi:hypothetical protein AB4084_11790, partial [Lysobacter sp. 2RAB21]
MPSAFHVPAGELTEGLEAYIRQSGVQLIYRVSDVRGRRTLGVAGVRTPEQALTILLSGTNLKPETDTSGAIALVPMRFAENGLDATKTDAGKREQRIRTTELEGILVTAQKRIERARDVPMAISVLSGDDLG